MNKQVGRDNLDEQRYRVLIDNAPEMVLILDAASGRFIDANQSAIDLLGFPREELLQLGPSDISPPWINGQAADEAARQHIESALAGANPFFEWIHINQQGKEIPCEIRLIRFPPYDRPIVRASIIDLRDQKRIEAALAESEERLQLALKASGLGCYDWYPRENRLLWDARMHELFGIDPSSAVDRGEFFRQAIHEDDVERVIGYLQTIMDPNNEQLTFEDKYRIVRDNRIMYVVSMGAVIRAENGEVQRLTGTIQDITERIETQEQLEYQATLLNKASDAVIETDAAYIIRSWNKTAEKMYGWTAEEAIGQSLRTLVPLTYLNESREEVFSRFQKEGSWHGEVIQQNKAGEELFVLSSVTALRNEQGEMAGSIGVNRDISDRKQAEITLRERNAFHRAIYDNSLNAVLVTDDKGNLHSFNQAACRILGFTDAELGRLSLTELPITNVGDPQTWFQSILKKGKETGELVFAPPGQATCVTQYYVVHIEEDFNLCVLVDITDRKRTEMQLQESEEKFSKSFHDNPTPMMLVDFAEKTIIDVNKAYTRLTDFLPEEVINVPGELGSQVIAQDNDNSLAEAFRIIAEQDRLSSFEVSLKSKFGVDKSIIVFAEPVDIQDRHLHIVTTVDITERKAIEEALRDREERFRTVFNQQFQFMAILSPEGRFLEVNDLSLQVVGVTHAEVLGRFFWKAPAWAKLPHWQGVIKDLILQAAQSQETLLAEVAFSTTNGEERWADTSFTAILNAAGELKYILVQASDITERKQAQENLLQAQQELSELAHRFRISTRAAQIGIWDWAIEKDQLIWDETMLAIYGITGKQFTGRMQDWQHYLHQEDLDVFQEVIKWSSTGQRELLNTEFRIQRTDGAIRHIKAVGSVQRNDQGQVVRIIGTNWDITQEKEAEQERIRARQLELRNRELEQFAYVASHDLQEPLRTVISFVGLLKRYYQDQLDERAHDYIQFVVEASSRMSQLIKGLLEYSRIGTNRALSMIDSAAVVQQILNDLSAQISHTEAVIEVAPLPQIKGFETELRMLFQNLISNAIKFRKEDQQPHIRIGVKEEKKSWVFSVADEGIGIAPMYQEQIFALFQRLHGREEYEGTGIGLAHCQKIADLHGGTIWVESEVGQGSTFFFSIAKSEKDLD